MTVRSDSLALGSVEIPAAGFATIYTVPADRTAIVKDVRLYVTGSAAPVALVVADGAALGLVHRIPVPDDELVYSPEPAPWVVMREGFELQIHGPALLATVYYVVGTSRWRPCVSDWIYRPCAYPEAEASPWCSAALRVLREVDPGGRSLGCFDRRYVRGSARTWSVHACGRAVDWMPSTFAAGQRLNHWLVHAGSPDLQLVIWNRQQWGGWRGPVTAPYTGADPHTTHLHIESRNWSPA